MAMAMMNLENNDTDFISKINMLYDQILVKPLITEQIFLLPVPQILPFPPGSLLDQKKSSH